MQEILRGETTIHKFDEDLSEFFEEDPNPKENIIRFGKEHIEECKKKSIYLKNKVQ